MYDRLIEEFYLAQSEARSVTISTHHPAPGAARLCVTPMLDRVFGILTYGGHGSEDHLPVFVFGPDMAIAWLKTKVPGPPVVHGKMRDWDEVRAMLVHQRH
jgi:hypothetical protein